MLYPSVPPVSVERVAREQRRLATGERHRVEEPRAGAVIGGPDQDEGGASVRGEIERPGCLLRRANLSELGEGILPAAGEVDRDRVAPEFPGHAGEQTR